MRHEADRLRSQVAANIANKKGIMQTLKVKVNMTKAHQHSAQNSLQAYRGMNTQRKHED